MASGADVIRKIKEQIEEVDPKEVHELGQNGNGAVIVDVREQHEFEESHVPGAVHVPRGHLESRIEGAVSDRSERVVLYCASGNRSALAAHTLQDLLGYEDVASMRGGITLWKDRGYEVEVPRSLSAEQRERYSHTARARVGWRARDLSTPSAWLEPAASLPRRPYLLRRRGNAGHRGHDVVDPPTSSARSRTPTNALGAGRSEQIASTRSTGTSRSTRCASAPPTSWRSSRATT